MHNAMRIYITGFCPATMSRPDALPLKGVNCPCSGVTIAWVTAIGIWQYISAGIRLSKHTYLHADRKINILYIYPLVFF